ncbi:EAL domain-containing protein [Oricola thermophila]|uniref:EAL domain-containing protein n=1 Tax=Oricola thermophila TaxID=2742145 RepID=A0A6N1VHT0_9HYPH|nr:EAL domain-containing protein [Oricola thermophila]QKV19255.1 EAL domain-containing protein [Oricola thermophila]
MSDQIATSPINDADIWQHALSVARLGVIDRNFATGETSHSASWKRMLGYDEHELPDHEDLWLSLMHPDDIERVRDISRRNVVGETEYLEAEFRLRHKSGEWRWFLGRGCVVERDPDTGIAIRLIALQTDITGQKNSETELRHANERLRLALDASGIGTWHYEPDTGRMFWDERMREIYGIGPEFEVSLDTCPAFVHPEDRDAVEAQVARLIETRETLHARYRIVRADEEIRFIDAHTRYLSEGQHSARVVGIVRDVTSEVRAAEALATEKETLRVTLHSIRDAVVATDGEGIITYANESAIQLFGCENSDMIGQPIGAWLAGRCKTRRDEDAKTLLAMAGDDGSERVIRHTAAPIAAGTGTVSGSVHTFQDVTQEHARKRELAYAARHDSLTGVLNRRAFEETLADFVSDAEAPSFALFYIDIDYFKAINDMAGHAAGDAALKGATEAMKQCLPSSAIVGRLGGDEFAAIVPTSDRDSAIAVAERMLEAIRSTPLPAGMRHRDFGASIGVEFVDAPGESATNLLARADDACYAAKAGGRNRVAVRDGRSDTAGGLAAIRMASDLGDAMEDGRLKLYAQELRRLDDPWNTCGTVEVLTRLVDTNGNNVPPSEFIPAAERFGMASMLDRWVIRQALERHGSQMGPDGALSLGFNLSAQTLSDPSLWTFVKETIAENGVAPNHVTFEITETATVTNFEAAQQFVRHVRALGCRVSLDDFGAGLSSFGYLRRFSVDSVKIDGEFVENIARSRFDRAIVSSITGIARDLGFYVVAERIEEEAALDVLRELGVRKVQGYLLHKPEPLEDLIARICGHAGAETAERRAG